MTTHYGKRPQPSRSKAASCPTADEVCRVIQLITLFDESEDGRLSLFYRMTHVVEGSTCHNPHEDWIAEFRKVQAYYENANKAPRDPTKVRDMPSPWSD